MTLLPPATRPCGSCPYRRDVPGGVWHLSEYEKLPLYDLATGEQPLGIFLCHRQDGRVCAGWCAVHDMENCLALRIAAAGERIDPQPLIDYTTDVSLFESGREAAIHGVRGLANPDAAARRIIEKMRDG